MKIPAKQELQQIAFNHSSDIDLQEFINLYKNCTAKPNNHDNYMIRLEMKNCNMILTEKL